jgi:ABC-2 type transport system permease protein
MSATRAIVRRTLFELRWQVAWYGAGLGLYAVAMVALFPLFEEKLRDLQYPAEILAFFGVGSDLSNPAVFLTAEYISFAPLILLIFSVVAATGALAGEEARGSLEILLSEPISRARLFTSKALALLLAAVTILAIILAGWYAVLPFVDLHGEVTARSVTIAHLAMLPAMVCYAGWGLFFAAIAPSRGQASGILAALLIAAYLVSAVAQAVEPIEWMKWLSPYYYADTSVLLLEGPRALHQALLLGAGLVGGILGLFAFAGREISAGVWQPGALLRGMRPASRTTAPRSTAR